MFTEKLGQWRKLVVITSTVWEPTEFYILFFIHVNTFQVFCYEFVWLLSGGKHCTYIHTYSQFH